MRLSAGDEFAGYTILRVLGAGGMGTVYLAQHPRLPRQDALKVLSAELTADPQYRTRFLGEADLAATLSHPNILGIHDRGEHDGQLWISMDFVEGSDAARLLSDRYQKGMALEEALEILTPVASALDYAHQRGLLPRDVKPANILLANPDSEARRIYLADFGIARRVDDTAGLTATNVAVGTVAYAVPEQLMGEPVDGRTDQYPLACTAFHLLAGAEPYDTSTAAAALTKHVTAPPPCIAHKRPELALLDSVFAKAMAKKLTDRYSRCQDFMRQLRRGLPPTYFHMRQAAAGPTQVTPGPLPATPPRQPSPVYGQPPVMRPSQGTSPTPPSGSYSDASPPGRPVTQRGASGSSYAHERLGRHLSDFVTGRLDHLCRIHRRHRLRRHRGQPDSPEPASRKGIGDRRHRRSQHWKSVLGDAGHRVISWNVEDVAGALQVGWPRILRVGG